MSTSSGRDESRREFPLRLGNEQDFARVESMLRSSGFDRDIVFDEKTVCQILNIKQISDLRTVDPEQVNLGAAGSEKMAVLIKLFLFLLTIPREEVESVMDSAELEALLSLDLIRTGSFMSSPEMYHATVLLYPVSGFLIASDRHTNPDGSPFFGPPDVVFPAIYIGTLRFLRAIGKSPARDALDLGSGTGIAALVLSKNVKRSIASDITDRATHFASFNRLLNRCYNVEAVRSDLYEAFEGQMFDRIVAHPPYVPSLSNTAIFRDAGATGESLIKGIIEGLSRHLRAGGTFYAVCAGMDTKEGVFEERVRGWLGQSHEEFDVLFALFTESSLEGLSRFLVECGGGDLSNVSRWEKIFKDAGVRQQVYGAIAIHRRAQSGGASRPFTVRTRLSESTDGACLEWALGWYRWRAQNEAAGNLAQAISATRPRLAGHLQVKVTHVVRDGTIVPAEFVLESERPFDIATKVDQQLLPLMVEFDGKRTAGEVYEAATKASMVPLEFDLERFAALVAMLIERGYLELDSDIFAAPEEG